MLTFIYYKIIETIANYSSKKHSDLEKISIKPTHIQQGSSGEGNIAIVEQSFCILPELSIYKLN